jgi:hypothetical protein
VESPELYLLADIRLVRPFPWQGKMSCFPVPDAAFKAMPKVSR